MGKIFISHKRDRQADDHVAQALVDAFADHEVFIDLKIAPGQQWAERIEQELRSSDYVLLLLSEGSARSEMVRGEIELVRKLDPAEQPAIIPIRVDYDGDLPYPLNAYLDRLQWVMWRGPQDDRYVIDQVRAAMTGADIPVALEKGAGSGEVAKSAPAGPLPAPAPETAPSNTGRLSVLVPRRRSVAGKVYIERKGEAALLQRAADTTHAFTLNIRAPRQTGKRLLLQRLIASAREGGKAVVHVDFKLLESATLGSLEALCIELCEWIADDLDLPAPDEGYWRRSPLRRCTKFIRSAVRDSQQHVMLVLEDMERLVDAQGQEDFFGMFRTLHDQRGTYAELTQLDLVLSASTDLHNFTAQAAWSPFNVGDTFDLEDFDAEQVRAYARDLGLSVDDIVIAKILEFLGGHPWLTCLAFEAYGEGICRFDADTDVQQLLGPRSPFNDHLRKCYLSLAGLSADEFDMFRRALVGKPCSDLALFWRLEGAGFLRGTARNPRARCQLYTAFFSST